MVKDANSSNTFSILRFFEKSKEIFRDKFNRFKDICISSFIIFFGRYIFGVLHEAGHALACELYNLQYEIFIWGPWGVNHDPNVVVWLAGGGFSAMILGLLFYIHRTNRAIKAGVLPLLFFHVISAFFEGFNHDFYMRNKITWEIILGILVLSSLLHFFYFNQEYYK